MKKVEIAIYIEKLCSQYAELNPIPKSTSEWLQAHAFISDQLPTKLETRKTKTVKVMKKVIVDGKEVEVRVDKQVPVIVDFDPSSRQTMQDIATYLEKAYINKPLPQIKFKERTNLRSFLEALKFVFPNVIDVEQAAASVMKWRMAFDDKLSQKCLYLFSPKSGGTGKTYFCEMMSEYIRRNSGKTRNVTELGDGFLDPKHFNANIVFLQDLNVNQISVEKLNNLIDGNEMSYNIKYGSNGTFTNNSMLVITSNYRPQNVNSRRWCEIDYMSYNMEDYPENEEKYLKKIADIFECCPKTFDFTLLKAKKPCAYNYDVMQYIVDHRQRDKSRPREFCDADNKLLCQMENMFIDWQSRHIFPTKWTSTAFKRKVFDWDKIAQFIIDNHWLDDEDDDSDLTPLEKCAKDWDKLIEKLCGEDKTPDKDGSSSSSLDASKKSVKPAASSKPASSFKDFVDTRLTHFSAKNRVSTMPTAQYCSNCVMHDGSKVTLKSTNEDVRPVVMAFESDEMTIEEQEANIKSNAWSAKTFSGNKSLHVLVQIPDEVSVKLDKIDSCDKYSVYHRLYRLVADALFFSADKLDMQCKSWLRKFRTPDGIRDTGAEQTAMFNDAPSALNWNSLLEFAILAQSEHEKNQKNIDKASIKEVYDASKNPKVRYYLDTPFLKKSGNGDSDASLYKAMCVCLSANDTNTLEEVKMKARSEKWTERELARKISNAERYIARGGKMQTRHLELNHFDKEEEEMSECVLPTTRGFDTIRLVMKNDYTYEEELKLASDRDMFDSTCLSCCLDDDFYDIDLNSEEKGE